MTSLPDLSSSFLKDLEKDAGISSSSEKEDERRSPSKPRSQLVEQADRSGVIVGSSRDNVRTPSFTGDDADLAMRWTNITSSLKGSNDNIAVILEHTNLRKNGSSAYIVFDDSDTTLLSNLKKSQSFRQISSGIKDEFGVDHLYLCTATQYSNQEKKNQESLFDKKIDDLNERSRNLGVPTDVHFGD